MEQLFLYGALAVLGTAYIASVIFCWSNGVSDEWWEPWVMGAVMPFWWLYEHRMGIVSYVVSFGVLGAVVWVSVLVGDFFRWIGSML